jgi:hypothetical protein
MYRECLERVQTRKKECQEENQVLGKDADKKARNVKGLLGKDPDKEKRNVKKRIMCVLG